MAVLRPLSEVTTLRVGGIPGAWHIASDAQAALDALYVIRHAALTPFVLGGGSNCVVSDDPATVGVLQLASPRKTLALRYRRLEMSLRHRVGCL
jgi:UDP-N-acetylenolpyruvoylglucosamine reductase